MQNQTIIPLSLDLSHYSKTENRCTRVTLSDIIGGYFCNNVVLDSSSLESRQKPRICLQMIKGRMAVNWWIDIPVAEHNQGVVKSPVYVYNNG